MNALLTTLRSAIQDTIASPAQNPSQTLLLASIALIILLIIVLALLMLITPRRRKVVKIRRYRVRPGEDDGFYHPESENPEGTPAGAGERAAVAGAAVVATSAGSAPASPPKKKRAKRKLSPQAAKIMKVVGTWGVFALAVIAVLSAYAITGSNVYCAKTCHVNQTTVAHAQSLDHASCVACHERAGLSGVPANVMSRVSMVVAKIKGTQPSGAIVDSQPCLRCHRNVLKGVTTSAGGVRMSHAAPIAAGMTCTSCHPEVGHGRPNGATMSDCLVCHDSKTASAACITCHTAQPLTVIAKSSSASTSTIGSGKITYPAVDIPARQCGACHNQVKECDTCHGLRMPHTDEFIHGGHAVTAAFSGKNVCWKCHTQQTDCGKCHSAYSPHPTTWLTAHQAYPWNTGCGCHHQGLNTGCFVCHQQAPPHALRQ